MNEPYSGYRCACNSAGLIVATRFAEDENGFLIEVGYLGQPPLHIFFAQTAKLAITHAAYIALADEPFHYCDLLRMNHYGDPIKDRVFLDAMIPADLLDEENQWTLRVIFEAEPNS